tara:strand:+ start:202 stop:804 length:603 start_codon:yes stop_codon:yes gene_type:complete
MSGIIAQNVGRHGGLIKAPSGGGGAWTLIETQTASASADISFTSGLDSTYDQYVFKFINIHPSADANFLVNFSIDGGSNYNVTKTTSFFVAYHSENDAEQALTYLTSADLAEDTGFQNLSYAVMDENDSTASGMMHLFEPSSTTFVKHFISTVNNMQATPFSRTDYVAGYGNTTSAIDAVQFKMASGNIDSGTISLYGIG